MPALLDIAGKHFGSLTVLSRNGKDNSGHNLCNCRCDCGNKITVRVSSLTTGNTKSCGCYHVKRIKKSNTTHGLSLDFTPLGAHH